MREFGGVVRGSSVVRALPLINAGSSPLVITGIKGVRAPFPVKVNALIGTRIDSGAVGALTVAAKGTGKAVSSAEMVVTTNDRPLHVLLTVSSSPS